VTRLSIVKNRNAAALLIGWLISGAPALFGAEYVNSELPWHDAVRDSQNRLLAWFHPEKNRGYDKVLKLAWDYMEHKVPNDANSGLKVYLVNAVAGPATSRMSIRIWRT